MGRIKSSILSARLRVLVPALLIASTLGVLTGCSKSDAGGGRRGPEVPLVDVIIASRDSLQQTIEVTGTISAEDFVELHPEVSGRLIYLNIPEGQLVRQGTVLARVNDTDLRAQLNKTAVQIKLAETTEQRLRTLLDVQGVNQADYDEALNQLNSLRADLEYTRALIEKTVVRAPFTGIVGLRRVSRGAYLTPASVIATMQKADNIRVDFSVPEEYADVIDVGSLIDVAVTNEDADARLRARVIAREPNVDVNSRNLQVRAVLLGGTAEPGSFAKVYLTKGNSQGSVTVPTNAIIPEAGTRKLVTVKGGKARFVEVETGFRTANRVEITRGIAPGDSIVVYGVLFARNDEPVKVRAVRKLSDIQ